MTEAPMDIEYQNPWYKRLRPLAFLWEIFFIIIALIGLAINSPEMLTIGMLTAAFTYPCGSWFFFMGETFEVCDIFAATFFGSGIGVVLIGYLFHLQGWAHSAIIMGKIGFWITLLGGILSFIFMVARRHKKGELGMSQKIFSRYVILLILFYACGMSSIRNTVG